MQPRQAPAHRPVSCPIGVDFKQHDSATCPRLDNNLDNSFEDHSIVADLSLPAGKAGKERFLTFTPRLVSLPNNKKFDC